MNTYPLISMPEVFLRPEPMDKVGADTEEPAGFVFQVRRPDVMAWATWLTWGRMGDERSLQRLRLDLEDKGIWRAAEDSADWGTAQALSCRWQSWTAYEIALASAAVLLLSPAGPASATRRAWASAGLDVSVKMAALTPGVSTPDGAPVHTACKLVAASCALNESDSQQTRAEGWRQLRSVLSDSTIADMPSAWRQTAWRLAERYHREQGDAVTARHFLGLLGASQPSASALMAQLRLGPRTDRSLASVPPLG